MGCTDRGILVVVSGFSGAGKGTVMKHLMSQYGDAYGLSVSATTRNPRPGEEEGKDYFFVTKEAFESMIAKKELIEYAKYVDNYYGTPKAYVEEQLALGKSVILEIEIQGALKVKQQFPDTKLMFITAPSAKELKDRLVGRGTEDIDVVNKRLQRATEEADGIENYDYLVVNDQLEECVARVHNIIQNECMQNAKANEHDRISSNINFINQIRNELNSFSKGE